MDVSIYLDVDQVMTAGDIQALITDGTIPDTAVLVSDSKIKLRWTKTTGV